MSADATSWVWKHSPFTGSRLIVHLAIADVVNDLHGNQFWMSTYTLAEKAKVSRSTVSDTLAEMVRRGLLRLIEAGGGRNRTSRYEFLMETAQSSDSIETETVQSGSETVQSTTDKQSAQRAQYQRDNPREPNRPAADAAPSSRSSAKEHNFSAKAVVDAFFAYVREETGHDPPEKFLAIRAIIADALAAGFTPADTKRGLKAIHDARPRPITRQTLWAAMQHPNGKRAKEETGWETDPSWNPA